MVCRSCGQPVESEHRFCPWCASPQRRKVVALFPPHPDVEASGRGLRVSRYFDPIDGPPHTRLSIYGADRRVRCVVALDDQSRTDLAQFLVSPGADGGLTPPVRRGVLDRLAVWRSMG